MATKASDLRKRLKEDPILDYAAFVSRETARQGQEDYAQSLLTADREYARSLSGYGTGGVSLERSGLDGSGYADYLDGVAYAQRRKSQDAAERALEGAHREGRQQYADLLMQAVEKGEEKKKAAYNGIIQNGYLRLEDAYHYALGQGISKEDAQSLAALAVKTNMNDTRRQAEVIRFCIQCSFYYEQSKLYAQRMGYSEEIASNIADTVSKYFRFNK